MQEDLMGNAINKGLFAMIGIGIKKKPVEIPASLVLLPLTVESCRFLEPPSI